MALAEYVCIILLIIVGTVYCNKNDTCPEETDLLRRLGDTRFYIIHGNKRGNFVNQSSAEQECRKYGLTMPKITNMRTFAIIGRLLEKLVLDNQLKDTWYWLPAYFTTNGHWYRWSGDGSIVRYHNFVFRKTRPVGVAAMVNYKNEYEINWGDRQCLTLALPWFGAWEKSPLYEQRGNQFSFDERPCESVKTRHAICESRVAKCNSTLRGPFHLTEDKVDYFEKGNWIIGNRQFIVNWQMRDHRKSEDYCKTMKMDLYEPNLQDGALIPFIKMWSREITYSTFWTNIRWNRKKEWYEFKNYTRVSGISWKEFFDEETGKTKPVIVPGTKTLQVEARGSDKHQDSFQIGMAFAYEFKGQSPCSAEMINSSLCEWHFREFIPSNIDNYYGVICSQKNADRNLVWDPKNIENVDELLNKTATLPFAFVNNTNTLRSTYKQTFGSLVCPPGYHMLRKDNFLWSRVKSYYTEFEYDYFEDYWVVDREFFNKKEDSNCTISSPNNKDGDERKFKQVPCTEWHFYLCQLKPLRQIKKLTAKVNPGNKMKWKEGPQVRTYPILAETQIVRNQQDMENEDVGDDNGVNDDDNDIDDNDIDDDDVEELDELSVRAERWETTKYLAGDFGCRVDIATEQIQVGIAVDNTGTNYPAIPHFAKQCKELLPAIKNIQPNTEFALTSHINWLQNVWKFHNDPEGCYKRLINFTMDDGIICEEIGKIPRVVGSTYYGEIETALPAVAFLVADTKIGWLPKHDSKQETNVYRIVLLMTDVWSKFELDYPGNRTEFKGDGTDTCTTSRPGTREFVGNFLKKHKILIIGLYNNMRDRYVSSYDEFFKEYDIPNIWKNFRGTKDWENNLINFIKNAVSKLVECIYEDPPAYNTLGL